MRQLDDWLTAYLKFTENTEPPLLFDKWIGVSTIAAVLQRKCYTEWETKLYPNFYIAIIAPAGNRKGTAMGPALRFLQAMNIRLAAEATTREALIKFLFESQQGVPIIDGKGMDMHASVTVFSPEMTVFLGYDNKQLLADLCDWFDCRDRWTYRTKTQGTDEIQGIWVNIIGATTPENLQTTLPRDAIGGGLTSRMIFVYGDRKKKLVPITLRTPAQRELEHKLLVDLEAIGLMSGEFVPTQAYLDAYVEWYYEHNEKPAIEDDNFKAYLERRPLHLRKLSMIMSASRGDSMSLDIEDFNRAKELLLETERLMPRVFKAYGSSPYAQILQRVMAYIHTKGEVSFRDLFSYFQRDVTVDELREIVQAIKLTGFAAYESKGNDADTIIRRSKGDDFNS